MGIKVWLLFFFLNSIHIFVNYSLKMFLFLLSLLLFLTSEIDFLMMMFHFRFRPVNWIFLLLHFFAKAPLRSIHCIKLDLHRKSSEKKVTKKTRTKKRGKKAKQTKQQHQQQNHPASTYPILVKQKIPNQQIHKFMQEGLIDRQGISRVQSRSQQRFPLLDQGSAKYHRKKWGVGGGGGGLW